MWQQGLVIVLCLGLSHWAQAAKVGAMAPEFAVRDSEGQIRKLSTFKGQFVVLEWHNPDCPYVRKHYNSHAMQKLQEKWTEEHVVWFVVNSSAPGKQGYQDAAAAQAERKEAGIHGTATLLDETGTMGRAYGAKTTPHMFVINPGGKLIYAGAIDDQNTADPASLQKAQNYVDQALTLAVKMHQRVKIQTKPPYGCSVKYGSP